MRDIPQKKTLALPMVIVPAGAVGKKKIAFPEIMFLEYYAFTPVVADCHLCGFL